MPIVRLPPGNIGKIIPVQSNAYVCPERSRPSTRNPDYIRGVSLYLGSSGGVNLHFFLLYVAKPVVLTNVIASLRVAGVQLEIPPTTGKRKAGVIYPGVVAPIQRGTRPVSSIFVVATT